MAKQSGLGPRGQQAIESAAHLFNSRQLNRPAQVESVADEEPQSNPAALTVELPDEREFEPSFWETFVSSRVREAAYDEEHQRLYVLFVKPVQSGGTPWIYEGVPPNVWRNFKRAKSQGKFVNRVLNQYSYHEGTWR